ncbi:MAG: class I SAM-dependent methyltransferase [Solirubrobacterales bacterium]
MTQADESSAVERSTAPAWIPDGSRPALLVRGDKHDQWYARTWEPPSGDDRELLGSEHEEILERTKGLEGLGYPEDSQKLYELAWFSPGDVVEIGTFRGRAAATMAMALETASNPARVISLDIDATALEHTASGLAAAGLAHRVTLARGTADTVLSRMPELRPGLVFVDGDHSYRGVMRDLTAIEPLVPNGSIVVLHDYEGYTAEDPYFRHRVPEAAGDSWLASECDFLGRFGLCGTFVRRAGGPPPLDPGAERPPLLLGLDRSAARVAVDRVIHIVDYRAFHLRRRLGGTKD